MGPRMANAPEFKGENRSVSCVGRGDVIEIPKACRRQATPARSRCARGTGAAASGVGPGSRDAARGDRYREPSTLRADTTAGPRRDTRHLACGPA